MQARKLYWTEVQIGETLPPLVKEPVTRVQIVKYAGASGDFNPMHIDEVYAKEAGMPGVFGHGMLMMGFLGQLVTGWAGVNGRLRSLGARFVKIVWPNDVITCCGRVLRLDHEKGRYTVSLDLWAENQKGELVVKGSAEVQIFHSPDDEARQARGDGPLVISNKPPPALEERIGAPMEPLRAGKGRRPRRKAAAQKKTTQRAAPVRASKPARTKAAKTTRRKAGERTATAGKRTASGRSTAARRATASKSASAKRTQTTRRPAAAKRAKAASKKAAPKKATARKTTSRKAASKKAASKKTASRKTAAKKTATAKGRKTAGRKATTGPARKKRTAKATRPAKRTAKKKAPASRAGSRRAAAKKKKAARPARKRPSRRR